MSENDWASEDDEQLSQTLSQSLSQEQEEPAAAAAIGSRIPAALPLPSVKAEEGSDDWASEDDEELSQTLLSQEPASQGGGGIAAGSLGSGQLAGWVSPRIKLEEAMAFARSASHTVKMEEPAAERGADGADSGSDSGNGSEEEEDERGVHPLLRKTATNELAQRLGAPRWMVEGVREEPQTDGQPPSPPLQLQDHPTREETQIGIGWTDDERHRFFRALRRCGKHPRKISERVGTKTAIEVTSYLQQLHAASESQGFICADESDVHLSPLKQNEEAEEEEDQEEERNAGDDLDDLDDDDMDDDDDEDDEDEEMEDNEDGADAAGMNDETVRMDGYDGGSSSTDEDAEAEDAGDCYKSHGELKPRRLKGRFPGGRCVRWPACEGEKPLPGNTVWEQRGWENLEHHEETALRQLGLSNLARYLSEKTGHNVFASFDCGAALELHSQMVALLAEVLKAAGLRAAARQRGAATTLESQMSKRAKAATEGHKKNGEYAANKDCGAGAVVAISVVDIAYAASSIAPHRYSWQLVQDWADKDLPPNPYGKKSFRPVSHGSQVYKQAQPRTYWVGKQIVTGPNCALPSAPPSNADMIETERKMREGKVRKNAFTEKEIQFAVRLMQ